MGADEQQEQPPAAPSPLTSTEQLDDTTDRVGPVKLPAKRPEPLPESKPARVGPEKLSATRRKK